MSKVYKTISRCQYMNDRSLKKVVGHALPTEVEQVIVTDDFKDGRLLKKTEVKKAKIGDSYKAFNWYDFSIDALNFTGQLNDVVFSQLSESNQMNVADKFDLSASVLDELMAQVPEIKTPEIKTSNEE